MRFLVMVAVSNALRHERGMFVIASSERSQFVLVCIEYTIFPMYECFTVMVFIDPYILVASIHRHHKNQDENHWHTHTHTHTPSAGITVTTDRPQFFLLLAVQVMVEVRDVTVICTV